MSLLHFLLGPLRVTGLLPTVCMLLNVNYKLVFSFHLLVYRHSFRQTFAEVYAPTGEWKSSLTIVIATITATLFGVLWLHYFGKYIIHIYYIPERVIVRMFTLRK